MVCILCQFDLPAEAGKLEEYTRWFSEEGLKEILSTANLQELRVFRNYAEISPQVTAMLFFPDIRSGLQAADSEMWKRMVANLTRWNCKDITLTVLVPSPIILEPKKPQP